MEFNKLNTDYDIKREEKELIFEEKNFDMEIARKDNTPKMVLELNEDVEKSINFSEIFFKIWSILEMISTGISIIMGFFIPLLFFVPYIIAQVNVLRASSALERLKYTKDEKTLKEYFCFISKAIKMFYIYLIIALVLGIFFLVVAILSNFFGRSGY